MKISCLFLTLLSAAGQHLQGVLLDFKTISFPFGLVPWKILGLDRLVLAHLVGLSSFIYLDSFYQNFYLTWIKKRSKFQPFSTLGFSISEESSFGRYEKMVSDTNCENV